MVGKEGSKRADHVLRYVVEGPAQYGLDLDAVDGVWRTLAEAYEEGRRLLHIHFRVNTRGDGPAQDFCAVFERLEAGDARHVSGAARNGGYAPATSEAHRDGEGNGLCGDDPQVGEPVLVFGRKFVKRPEQIPAPATPSLVRLQFLDECLRLWMDAPELFAAFVIGHGLVAKDRELQPSSAIFGQWADIQIGNSEFVDEVVESGAKVVQVIPDGKREGGRHGFGQLGYEQLFVGLEVEIVGKAMRASFEPGVNFDLEALQVLDSPR